MIAKSWRIRLRFLDTRNEKSEALSLQYIKDEMLFIIIAGADTTGTAFQGLLMHILTNPRIYEAVMRELDEATVAKIDILGSGYKDKLLAQIPAESLPKEFGGTCQCPGGCSLSDAGPWNPSK